MGDDPKRTPLYEEHLALGARMVPFAGYAMPVQYAGIIEEHRAVRAAAGVFDVSHMAEFRVSGPGARPFLQSILTNDLDRIAGIGGAQYTLLCDEDGGIVDDLIVYRTGDHEYLVIANASNREADLAWMRAHVPDGMTLLEHLDPDVALGDGDFTLVDESDRTALIAVQGPSAIRIISELARAGFELPPRFHMAEALVDGVPALLARTGYTGEDGVEILLPAPRASAVWRALLSFEEVSPCGLGARDTLRLEMGYALHGSDIGPEIDPVSAGLQWAVARDTGPYVGSGAIERIREAGPATKRVGLRLEEGIPRHGCPVLHEGREVGKVASGTFSPTLQVGIAIAYVPAALAAAGQALEILIRKKTVPAKVSKLPFVEKTSLSKTGV